MERFPISNEINHDLSVLNMQKDNYNKIIAIVLNYKITFDTDNLFDKADIIICADGGADKYFEKVGENGKIPNFIIGDLDSITKSTHDYYKDKGTSILQNDSQTTDYEKSLYFALEKISSYGNEEIKTHIIVVGASGGRLDHSMNNYQISCKYDQILKENTKSLLYLVGESTISLFLDMQNLNIIKIPIDKYCHGYSLIPFNCEIVSNLEEVNENNEILKTYDVSTKPTSYYFNKTTITHKIKVLIKKLKFKKDHYGVTFNLAFTK